VGIFACSVFLWNIDFDWHESNLVPRAFVCMNHQISTFRLQSLHVDYKFDFTSCDVDTWLPIDPVIDRIGLFESRGVNVGCGGGSPPPPEKWSSRSQTKCSWSQNYAFVYMQCFAKQIKYSGETRDWVMTSIELEICSNGSNSSEIIWRNITYLFGEFMNELSVKTRTKGWSFHLLSKHGDIYMSRLRVGTFIWNLGSARSFTGDILY
jgi:hypothetical protein